MGSDRRLVPGIKRDFFAVPDVIDPPGRRCFMLSVPDEPTHLANFFGALRMLSTWFSYERTGDTSGKQTADVWRDIVEDIGMGIDFRQTGCKLEMSCDGVTWKPVMDFGACLAGSGSGGIEYEKLIDEFGEIFDGGHGSIGADDAIYDGTSKDDQRDTALCLAIRAYIEAIARTWVEKDQANDSRNRLIQTAGIVIGSGVLAFCTAGVGNLVAGAVGSAIALIATFIDLEDETQLYADETLDAVQCYMYTALAGQTSVQQDFQDSLSGKGNDTDYVGKLATVVDEVNQRTDSYLSFLKLWAESVTYAEDGLIANSCTNCGLWEHIEDLSLSDGGYVATTTTYGEIAGEHTPGVGWTETQPQAITGCAISKSLSPSFESTITFMQVEYDLDNSGHWDWSSMPDLNEIRVSNDAGLIARVGRSCRYDPSGAGKTQTWEGSEVLTVDARLYARVNTACDWAGQPLKYGSCTIKRITLRGVGANPFV